ncbi:hypothetical protein H0G86_004665 [Trichoderma simmonsii]|uniref:Uncharacterized protein n=1 Tax=Trichoderma simmonsii TaxID=1491479 RepID=A0A8G0L869_9HYPO|nr:hypothetical protein H0G86_004665 [Trichoderma simmonsii]
MIIVVCYILAVVYRREIFISTKLRPMNTFESILLLQLLLLSDFLLLKIVTPGAVSTIPSAAAATYDIYHSVEVDIISISIRISKLDSGTARREEKQQKYAHPSPQRPDWWSEEAVGKRLCKSADGTIDGVVPVKWTIRLENAVPKYRLVNGGARYRFQDSGRESIGQEGLFEKLNDWVTLL